MERGKLSTTGRNNVHRFAVTEKTSAMNEDSVEGNIRIGTFALVQGNVICLEHIWYRWKWSHGHLRHNCMSFISRGLRRFVHRVNTVEMMSF